jgi:hypothetical protein
MYLKFLKSEMLLMYQPHLMLLKNPQFLMYHLFLKFVKLLMYQHFLMLLKYH